MKHYSRSVWLHHIFILLLAWAGTVQACPTCHPQLAQHTQEFEKRIYKVTDGVWVAVGYGIANSIMIEGNDGVIIVDVMESVEAAQDVKKDFDKIVPNKPVKAIIYTHNHADHCFGATAFAGDDNPLVISHATTIKEFANILNVIQPIIYQRAMRQFGNFLGDGDQVNDGIGLHFNFDGERPIGLILPNHTFSGESTTLQIAGVKMELVHAPGETDDQIFVWLPEKKVLLPGDNFYKAFPNLYAIRGTSKRDTVGWVASLDKMRARQPEFLVPSHTRPIKGRDEIMTRLTNYRDAIQFVHDQTVFYMNLGLSPSDIVERVKLPQHLAEDPYLQEYYGKVEWSIRSIFTSYLGWYSGEARDLYPVGNMERAQSMAKLVGGPDALARQAKSALASGNPRWALQLADDAVRLKPESKFALEIKVAALEKLAEGEISANGRNYLLTMAREAQGKISIPHVDRRSEGIGIAHVMPLHLVFDAMKIKLDKDKSADVTVSVNFSFTDTEEEYSIQVRKGVAEIQARTTDTAQWNLRCNSMRWKEVLAGFCSAGDLLKDGDVEFDGQETDLGAVLHLFSPA
ncbi:MAG: MBL fold metallo-hydrolase, partial [Chlamydiia bacterium]|nr:MBL fold metallo-hydrolase [Chlamydiia bacterium]